VSKKPSKRSSPRKEPAWSVALRKESERLDRERIRARLALPMEKRTNFLRVRLPSGGTAL
jgi:hypothetical protein